MSQVETKIDWNLLKFQYEMLGVSLEQLVEENSAITLGLLKEQAATQGWQAGSIESLLPAVVSSSPEDGLDSQINAMRAQLVGASLLKQKALFPAFAKAEAVLLSKVMEATFNLDTNEERAVNKLANLVKALQGLLQQNQFLTTTITDDKNGMGGLTVQILNTVS